LDEREIAMVLLHETQHIRRGDHVWKLLSFAALCIHWFNPLVWLAFCLAGKDMEMSCDEAVLKAAGEGIRADYAQTLLRLSAPRRMVHAMPLAFGEGDTKGRVKNMLKWKKAKPLVLVLAAILCIAVFAACAVNREDRPAADPDEDGFYFLIDHEDVWQVSVTLKNSSGGVVNADGSAFKVGEKVYLEPITELMDLQGAEIAALDKDGEVIYRIAWHDNATAEDILALAEDSGWLIIPERFSVGIAGDEDDPEDVTVIPSAQPITADYAVAEKNYDYVYETAETEYVTYMEILPQEDITDVAFGLLTWDGAALIMDETLYTAPAMKAGETFLAAVVFYGDMTTYGVTFTDAAGETRSFSLMISGMDGSLECLETQGFISAPTPEPEPEPEIEPEPIPEPEPAPLNPPFTSAPISWSSPLNGMFERTYETHLSMLRSGTNTEPPFLPFETHEFADCAIVAGSSLASIGGSEESVWVGSVYILVGDLIGVLPLPVDAQGVKAQAQNIMDHGNGTVSYEAVADGVTYYYTVDVAGKCVSMNPV